MHFFCVGTNKSILEIISRRSIPICPNVLTSIYRMSPGYHQVLQGFKKSGVINLLALDSGTFTLNAALKKGKKIKFGIRTLFNRLALYAKAHQEVYSIVFNFDLDYSPDGYEINMKYLKKLKREGIDAWPVIHDPVGRDYENYAAHGFTKMAIGQCEDRDLNVINSIISDLNNRGITQIHILGVASPRILPQTMAWSADASSPSLDTAYGHLNYWHNANFPSPTPKVLKVPQKDAPEPATKDYCNAKDQFMSWLDDMDSHIKWEDLRGPQQSYFMTIVNMLFYDKLAKLATVRQKLRQRQQQAYAC